MEMSDADSSQFDERIALRGTYGLGSTERLETQYNIILVSRKQLFFPFGVPCFVVRRASMHAYMYVYLLNCT